MTQRRFVPVAETAKLIRAQLKINFPGVKFSVRSSRYAGGASIDVEWTDGPLACQVDPVARAFQGGGFDGSIDMAYCVEAWLLPDGSATFAKTSGTAGSGGYISKGETQAPAPGAERVRFGSDYVHTKRENSNEMIMRAIAATCRKWGVDQRDLRLKTSAYSGKVLVDDFLVEGAGEYFNVLVYRDLVKRTNYFKAKAPAVEQVQA